MTRRRGSGMLGCAASFIGLAMIGPVAAARAQPAEQQHATPRLTAERAALVPGEENWIGITFEIDPGWHLYWNGVNDTGMPPSVSWKLPEGFVAGSLLWPAPVRHVSPGDLLDHIYEQRVTLLVPIAVPADAQPGAEVTLAADLEWLVCKEACFPGWGEVSLTLPVASPGARPAPGKDVPLFEQARARLPKPVTDAQGAVASEWSGDRVRVRVDGARALVFFPEEGSVRLVDPIETAASKGGELRLTIEPPEEGPARLVGVLEVTTDDPKRPKFYRLDVRQPESASGRGG